MVSEKTFRIVFMGTPEFAATILKNVADWSKGKVVGVYTQPDKPAKRGHKTIPSAVKTVAEEYGFPVFQPSKLNNPEVIDTFSDLKPDFLLVAAYGLLIPKTILELPTFPPLNVHGSLLPKYRGAAPIQRAILNQEEFTGVSIMQLVEELDAGPVYKMREVAILEKTSDDLFKELATVGADLLVQVLNELLQGNIRPKSQDESSVTYAAKLKKEDGLISFHCKAQTVHARIRAVTSWPAAHIIFEFNNMSPIPVLLLPGHIETPCSDVPGTVEHDKLGLRIATQDFWYRVTFVKPQGKRFMSAKSFLNGRNVPIGICGHVLQENF